MITLLPEIYLTDIGLLGSRSGEGLNNRAVCGCDEAEKGDRREK